MRKSVCDELICRRVQRNRSFVDIGNWTRYCAGGQGLSVSDRRKLSCVLCGRRRYRPGSAYPVCKTELPRDSGRYHFIKSAAEAKRTLLRHFYRLVPEPSCRKSSSANSAPFAKAAIALTTAAQEIILRPAQIRRAEELRRPAESPERTRSFLNHLISYNVVIVDCTA